MRLFFTIYLFAVLLILTVFGFRGCKSRRTPIEIFPDMDRQAKFLEQSKTDFFEDGRTDRPPVPGTVPHLTTAQQTYNHLSPDNRFREDDYLVSGRVGEGFGDGIPVELSYDNMARGKELFTIYCSMCHGDSGNGKGVIADERYGYATIISIIQQRIIDQPDGEIYNTIVNGKNTMGPYGSKIRTEDRWKVVMYVRALQRAGNASIDDVPAEHRKDLGL